MSTYRMTIKVEVDDAALAAHDGNKTAPPNAISEWFDGDVFEAWERGILEPVHDEIDAERIES